MRQIKRTEAEKLEISAKRSEYGRTHPDKIKAWNDKYYKRHGYTYDPEAYKRNKEAICAKSRRSHMRHRVARLAKMKEYREYKKYMKSIGR